MLLQHAAWRRNLAQRASMAQLRFTLKVGQYVRPANPQNVYDKRSATKGRH